MPAPHVMKRFLGKWRVYASNLGQYVAFTQPFQNAWQDAGTTAIAYGVNPSASLPSLVLLQSQSTLRYLVPNPAGLSRSAFGPPVPGHQLQALESDFDLAYTALFQSGALGSMVSDLNGALRFVGFNWGVCTDAYHQAALGYTEQAGQLLSYDVRMLTPSLPAIRVSGGYPNGDFSHVDFNGEDLSGLAIPNANLQGARLAGCRFVKTDLTGTAFQGVDLTQIDLSGAILNGCDFTGVPLGSTTFSGGGIAASMQNTKFATNGAKSELDRVSFAGVDLTGADFTGASLVGTDFRGATLLGVTFSGCDLTHAQFDPVPKLSHDPQQPMRFAGATVPFAVIGRDWRGFDLSHATIVNLPQTLSTGSAPLKAAGARLSGLNDNDLSGMLLEHADFSNAILNGLNFHETHLAATVFIQARMHGTVLTNTTLTGADFTGAQLGSQGLLFTLATGNAQYAPFLAALNGDDATTVAKMLDQNGVQVGPLTIDSPPNQRGSVWVLTDTRSGASYTVRLLSVSGQTVLSVFDNHAEHADLGDAYLPGAILTSANLYGVTASGIHLYGPGTKLDNAILESIDLTKANLGGASLKQAALYDAILDDAILTNTDFEGAFLAPGQGGRGVSAQRANLQGADFSGANLYGANLQDAAVCLPLASDPSRSYGVWLKEVGPQDAMYATCLVELSAGVQLVSLDAANEANLEPGPVGAALRAAFSEQGIRLESDAQVAVIEDALTWQIVDGSVSYVFIPGYDDNLEAAYLVVPSDPGVSPFTVPLADQQYLRAGPVAPQLQQDVQSNGGVTLTGNARLRSFLRPVIWQIDGSTTSYTVWEGYDSNGDTPQRVLYARPSIPALTALFQAVGVTLKRTTISGIDGMWTLDNDSASAYNTTLGYVVLNVVQAGTSGPLDLYGSTMRIERLGDDNQLQYYDIVSQPTELSADNFDADTVYPNGNKETIVDGQVQASWMRAAKAPRPPNCVPSDMYFCPRSSTASPRH